MTAFDVITGKLKRHMMATVRDIFDVVLDEYGNMEMYLTSDADIVERTGFERGLAKVHAGMEATHSRGERKVQHRLLAAPQADHAPQLQRWLKEVEVKACCRGSGQKNSKKARKRTALQSKSIDVSWTTATSVVVERFFSTVKSTVGYLRKCMSASTLETVMFLKLNWDLVTLPDFSTTVENSKGTDRS
ncbi:hypothetical protein PF007_g12291 [Phytophthora fragariae]|uniref:HAT C-terminal dimerisation domain-containing protein n=1 Tax=Phytophthora fragariae TaxID=53985 RepID=A0A6A3S3U7_9STRA|nr:hypothetical protein PF007_g12291 [Phytophthora fragariae]